MAHFTRRSALTIIAAGGASIASGRAWAEDKPGRVIYPVAVPVYQTQFLADRLGYFKEAGLDCKLIQGGSGVKTREIIASAQGDIGIGDITHPMQLSNRGRNGRVLMPVDTRSSSVMFIIRKDLWDQGITSLEKLTEWKRPTGASRSSRCRRWAAPTMSGRPITWRRWSSTRKSPGSAPAMSTPCWVR
jgi:NitT/TauT family transport system substrate-binding protein